MNGVVEVVVGILRFRVKGIPSRINIGDVCIIGNRDFMVVSDRLSDRVVYVSLVANRGIERLF